MALRSMAVSALIVLAGAVYYFAKPQQTAGMAAVEGGLNETAPAARTSAQDDWYLSEYDRLADAEDARLVRDAVRDLTDEQTNNLIFAAGRRFMRRKLAYEARQEAVKAGEADPATLAPLKREMEQARKLCDLAGSLGQRAREYTRMAREHAELERRFLYAPSTVPGLADRFDGVRGLSDADLREMEAAFAARFGKPLPVSARGDSAVHRALGFDHRGRVDVAISPEKPEGIWVRDYLRSRAVSFFAFRSAVPGAATGAHIHIGPASHRLGRGD